jgi:hypothetical protein
MSIEDVGTVHSNAAVVILSLPKTFCLFEEFWEQNSDESFFFNHSIVDARPYSLDDDDVRLRDFLSGFTL